MKALIDGDIATYRIGHASNDVDVGLAAARMDHFIKDILQAVGAEDYRVFLTATDKSNFRFKLYPEYKSNRTLPKPRWYDELRAHLVSEHRAEVVEGREADDALADAQTEDTIICTIDKDLDQISGKHYDFVKKVIYEIFPDDGTRWFYHQILCGDRIDNIPGIKGVGPKTASRILEGAQDEAELFHRVRQSYQDAFLQDGDRLMLLYGQLLKIGGDLWLPESLVNTEVDSKPSLDERSSDSSDSDTKQQN